MTAQIVTTLVLEAGAGFAAAGALATYAQRRWTRARRGSFDQV